MRDYAPTLIGETIAAESGLEALGNRLSDRDFYPPVLLEHLITTDTLRYRNIEYGALSAIEEALETARAKLKTGQEAGEFDGALDFDLQTYNWRRVGGLATDTLFPIRTITDFAKPTNDDQLVLSGAVGLSLVNFRQHSPVLARNRYKEFGFNTFNEACAFAGAYIVGRLINTETQRYGDSEPSFSYSKDGIRHTVSVGGTMHGDFRMQETWLAESDVVSPIKTMTEFGPKQSIVISGYHSIEPDIVAALIEAEFLQSGIEAAKKLANEFVEVFDQLNADDPRDAHKTPFVVPPFADFGDGDMRFTLISLGLLLTHDDHNPLRVQDVLHSTPHLPQSKVMFEIVPTEEGVRFQNGQYDIENVKGIDVNRSRYLDLFKALVGQTSGGMGRTAPSQLFELVHRAKDMLNGNLKDYEFLTNKR